MKKYVTAASIGLVLITASFAYAQSKTYKYKCPKCGRIVEYAQITPGVKCPSGDGWIMTQFQ